MNSQSEIEEPRTAAELIARYRDVRRHLYAPSPPKLASNETRTDRGACQAIPVSSRQPEQGSSQIQFYRQTPAREALRAVSNRTGVPLADILGRDRRPPIAAARHEAVWRVRQATVGSLPRLGRFFNRDHTTVRHSIREMKKRSARDPALLAYETAPSVPEVAGALTTSSSSHFPFAPSSVNLEK